MGHLSHYALERGVPFTPRIFQKTMQAKNSSELRIGSRHIFTYLFFNTFKLSLLNLYRVKYFKEAFYFWFQELCSLVTCAATLICLHKFGTKFTILCSCNP